MAYIPEIKDSEFSNWVENSLRPIFENSEEPISATIIVKYKDDGIYTNGYRFNTATIKDFIQVLEDIRLRIYLKDNKDLIKDLLEE